MNYYRECPNCGAHLDPGEKCDCGQAVSACTSSQPDTACARQPDWDARQRRLTAREYTPTLHSCASCAWCGRGGEGCDDPAGGAGCKLYTPSAQAIEQACELVDKLQMAYRLHLANRLSKRLPWLESCMDQLHQWIGNWRP